MEEIKRREHEAATALFRAFVQYSTVVKETLGEDHKSLDKIRRIKNDFFDLMLDVEDEITKLK